MCACSACRSLRARISVSITAMSTFQARKAPLDIIPSVSTARRTSSASTSRAFTSFMPYGLCLMILHVHRLLGVTGAYQSPAKTATHVHEAPKGRAGPPRIAFPNPTGDGYKRTSYGCLQGPFTTGILANGVDTGSGFKVSQIEANPSGFFADVHTTKFVAGAVRGQLEKLEKKW